MYKALTLPLLVTLFFHGVILAVILIDAPESQPQVRRAATEYIKAELITLEKPKAKKPKPKPKKKTAAKKKPKSTSKAQQEKAKAQKLAEQKKAEQLQQQAEAAKQKQLEQQRLAQEEQQRIQRETEEELADAIAEENAQVLAMDDEQLASSYIALITDGIQRNWNRPPSARNNMEAELIIQLVPTGEVVSVKILRGSGNAAFDRSAESAVLKAERFPELQKLPARVFERYFRRLKLKFRPEDLRL